MEKRSFALGLLTFAGAFLVHTSSANAQSPSKPNPILALLGSGKAVFGAFSGEKTKENSWQLYRFPRRAIFSHATWPT
jgi:hypothetical protein